MTALDIYLIYIFDHILYICHNLLVVGISVWMIMSILYLSDIFLNNENSRFSKLYNKFSIICLIVIILSSVITICVPTKDVMENIIKSNNTRICPDCVTNKSGEKENISKIYGNKEYCKPFNCPCIRLYKMERYNLRLNEDRYMKMREAYGK